MELKINSMVYNASLDKLAKGVTIGVTLLFAVIIALSLSTIITGEGWIRSACVIILLLLIYFGALAFRVIDYRLTGNQLIIHRFFSDVSIERQQISSLQLLNKENIKGTFRTFGAGGLFGYFGQFSNSKLGRMTWYATRMDKAILIETNAGKKIMVTPNDPEKFLSDYGGWSH